MQQGVAVNHEEGVFHGILLLPSIVPSRMKLVNRRISFPQKGRDENADFAGRDDGAAAPARAGDDGGGGSGVCAVRAQRDAGGFDPDAVADAGEPMRTRNPARYADAAGLVRRVADGCAARLLAMQGSRPHREQKALAVSCATMSPCSCWDNRKLAEQPNRGGNCAAERAGRRACRAGRLAKRWTRVTSVGKVPEWAAMSPVSFARAVEDSARTMLSCLRHDDDASRLCDADGLPA